MNKIYIILLASSMLSLFSAEIPTIKDLKIQNIPIPSSKKSIYYAGKIETTDLTITPNYIACAGTYNNKTLLYGNFANGKLHPLKNLDEYNSHFEKPIFNATENCMFTYQNQMFNRSVGLIGINPVKDTSFLLPHMNICSIDTHPRNLNQCASISNEIIKIWDIERENEIVSINEKNIAPRMEFFDDNNIIVASNHLDGSQIALHDMRNPQSVQRRTIHSDSSNRITVCSNNSTKIGCYTNTRNSVIGATLLIYDISAGKCMPAINFDSYSMLAIPFFVGNVLLMVRGDIIQVIDNTYQKILTTYSLPEYGNTTWHKRAGLLTLEKKVKNHHQNKSQKSANVCNYKGKKHTSKHTDKKIELLLLDFMRLHDKQQTCFSPLVRMQKLIEENNRLKFIIAQAQADKAALFTYLNEKQLLHECIQTQFKELLQQVEGRIKEVIVIQDVSTKAKAITKLEAIVRHFDLDCTKYVSYKAHDKLFNESLVIDDVVEKLKKEEGLEVCPICTEIYIDQLVWGKAGTQKAYACNKHVVCLNCYQKNTTCSFCRVPAQNN